jgi:hypothetical protein
MTKTPHDQFAKQYLKGMLSSIAKEVIVSYERPVGEAQQVDVWFIPKSRQPIPTITRTAVESDRPCKPSVSILNLSMKNGRNESPKRDGKRG